MDDGMLIDVFDGGHEALLEFLFGSDADVAQNGTGELGEETLDKVEPRAVLGGEGEFEAPGGLCGEPSFRLFGVPHRALPDLQCMKLCYTAAAASASRSAISWCD